MNSYRLLLVNEKEVTYRYITLFILLINLFVSFFIYFISQGKVKYLHLGGAILCLVSLLLFLLYSKRSIRYEIQFIILAVLWFLSAKYLLGSLMLVFALMGYAIKKPVIVLTRDKIIFPSFPQKEFGWDEVVNVMLKDGIITIDLKNNKLIQSELEQSGSDIDEKEFNNFCKTNLFSSIG